MERGAVLPLRFFRDSRGGSKFYVARWATGGALVGVGLVLVAWRIAVATEGPLTFAELHDRLPVMWVVDLLPTLLGMVGVLIGSLYARVDAARRRAEELAWEITDAWTQELHASNASLVESMDMQQEQFASLSHELRTPLTAMLGYVELAQAEEDTPGVVEGYLAEIHRAGRMMLDVIRDLLDVAKLARTGVALEIEDVGLHVVVKEAVAQLEPLAQQKGLALKASSDDFVACRADEVRLRQVLTNLVANAIKYSERGTIEVRAIDLDERVRVDVTDEGVGMTPDEAGSVFDAYAQTAAGRGRLDSTGLGLAVVKTFVEAMDGTVAASSDGPGRGSTFSIELPSASGAGSQTRTARFVA